MKKLWYLVIATLTIVACGNETESNFDEGTITVSVSLDDFEGGKVVLESVPAGPKRIQLDTLEVESAGKTTNLTFKTPIKNSGFYSVYVPGKQGELRFIAEPGDSVRLFANVKAINASARIGGTPENERLDSLIAFIKATKYYTDSLNNVFQKAQAKQMHHALFEEFQALYGNAKRMEETVVLKYITSHPDQLTNLIAINSLDKNRHRSIFKQVDEALVAKYPNNENVKAYHKIIEQLFPQIIGKPAPNFTLMDKENKQVSLSDFKGMYVLLDFWATWCRPCIAEIPNLKRIKNDFGGDKFEIISVCIDRNNPSTIATWNSIDEKFQTNWVQLFDANGEATAKKYNVKHFPTLLVVDPEGNICEAGDHIRGNDAYGLIKKLVGNE